MAERPSITVRPPRSTRHVSPTVGGRAAGGAWGVGVRAAAGGRAPVTFLRLKWRGSYRACTWRAPGSDLGETERRRRV